MSVLVAILVIALFCAGAMALAWRVAITSGRSGWADTFWSLTVGVAGVTAALWPIGELTWRSGLVALLVAFWSGRLGLHIARRTLRGGDDPRYAELKRGWGDNYKSQLLLFLEIQAGVALVLAIAVMAAANNPAPLGVLDALGVLTFVGVQIDALPHDDACLADDARIATLRAWAQVLARAVPGLRGYVGVDLVWHAQRGPVLIEINPRVTMACVGLSAALGRNLASAVLAAHHGEFTDAVA